MIKQILTDIIISISRLTGCETHDAAGRPEATHPYMMKISEVIQILSAEVIWGDEKLCEREVQNACGSDLMSDVLAYVKDQSLLLTGLVNPQVIRTAEMMDFLCIAFVRGKRPDDAMIQLASEYNIVLISTEERMFSACGKLYAAGLDGSGL